MSRLQALGITNAEQFASLRKRLEQVEPGAGDDVDASIQLAADEREATAKGRSVKTIRTERARQEQAGARRYDAAMAAEEKAKPAQFPSVAVFGCTVGHQKTALQACMSSGPVDTEIGLRNGKEYRMHKIHDVASMGGSAGNEMIVDWRRNFEIKAQNADRILVMSLVVKDRTSGRVLRQRSAAQFGVMRVTNQARATAASPAAHAHTAARRTGSRRPGGPSHATDTTAPSCPEGACRTSCRAAP